MFPIYPSNQLAFLNLHALDVEAHATTGGYQYNQSSFHLHSNENTPPYLRTTLIHLSRIKRVTSMRTSKVICATLAIPTRL